MMYHLSGTGLGLAIDKSPFPDFGKVIFTFRGEPADYVCVCGEFHPIVSGVAEVTTAGLPDVISVSAYSLAERRRYVCDPLMRIGSADPEGTSFLAPAPEGEREIITVLADRLASLEERFQKSEARLSEHEARISGNTITFGGLHETKQE